MAAGSPVKRPIQMESPTRMWLSVAESDPKKLGRARANSPSGSAAQTS